MKLSEIAQPHTQRSALNRLLFAQLLDAAIWIGVVAVSFVYLLALFHDLGIAPLWHDEGLTWWTARPQASIWTVITGAAAVDHPPLYFLIVHLFVTILGDGEWALRLPSALGAAVTLPLVYGMAIAAEKAFRPASSSFFSPITRAVGARAAGLAAVVLLLRHPYLWQYGLEARMYALLAALAVASVLCLFLLCRTRSRFWAILYGITTAALLYTHYYALLVLLAEWLVVALAPRFRQGLRLNEIRQRKITPLLGGLLMPVLLFAPWMPVLLHVWTTHRQNWRPVVGPLYVVTDLLAKLSWGQVDWRSGSMIEAALPLLGLALLGAVLLSLTRVGGWAILMVAALPVALVAGGTLLRPLYVDRYLLFTLPFWALLAGAGLTLPGWSLAAGVQAVRGRKARTGVAASICIAMSVISAIPLLLPYLDQYRQSVVVVKEDWRAAATYIAEHGKPGDIILAYNDSQWEDERDAAFRYYYERIGGSLPVRALPTYPVTQESAYGDLSLALGDAQPGSHVWVLDWNGRAIDPHGWAIAYLQNSLAVETVVPFTGLLDVAALRVPQSGLHLRLDNAERTIAANLEYETPHGPLVLQSVALSDGVKGGETLQVHLRWSVPRPLSYDYAAFVHLITPGDVLYSANDHLPLNDFYRISKWQAGEELSDSYDLPVLPGTPPGSYRIEVGVYDPATGKRMPVHATPQTHEDASLQLNPDRALIPVEINRTDAAMPLERYGIATPLNERFNLQSGGEVDLIGTTLRREGESLFITLFWRPSATPVANVETAVAVREGDKVIATVSRQAVDGIYPTGHWQSGEVVREVFRLVVPPGSQRTLQVGFDGQVVTLPVQVP